MHDGEGNEATQALRGLGFPEEWQITARYNGRARRLSVTMDEYVHVTVTVPDGMEPAQAARLVRAKQMWLYRQARQLKPYIPAHPVKELVSGEGFPLFGRSHRLRIVDGGPPLRCDETTRVSGWTRGFTQEIHLRRDHADTADALIGWYTGCGRDLLLSSIGPHSLDGWVRRLALRTPPQLEIKALRPRTWGRWNARTNTLALDWALFQLEPDLLDLVVVRELLKAPTSATYKVVPIFDADWCAERLRREGARAWIGDVAARPDRG